MSQLAGNPPHKPQLSQTVVLKSGKNLEVADPRAIRALIALMDMQAVLGGAASHFGGPSGFAELSASAWGIVFHESELKARPWHELFHMVNDAGHCENGIYALKALYGHAGVTIKELKSFRSVQSRLTGHGESHLFPQGVYLSNGPLGSTLPQAEGLALADRMGRSDRVTVITVSDGGLMEGEAREALASLPGLAAREKVNPFVMIISDNNTKLTGRIDKDSFSMEPTFEALKVMGWEVLSLANGHSLQSCAETFQTALELARKNPSKPVAIHAKTIKGYGIKACQEAASGGHGFPLKDTKECRAFVQEIYGTHDIPDIFIPWLKELEAEGERRAQLPKPTDAPHKEKIQVGVAKAMIERKKKGFPVVSITADLPGSTGVLEFQKKYSEAVIDVGVAESNMVSIAAGFSKQGFIPVVDTFAQFGVTKGALPLTMAALSQAPIIAIFSHTGFQDAADGASHQALSYLSQVGSIPHTEVFALTCSQEAEALVGQAIDRFHRDRAAGKTPPSFVFFLGREDFPPQYTQTVYELGRAQILFDSQQPKKITLAVAGSLASEAIKAAQELESQGIGATVINLSALNRPDIKTLKNALEKSQGRLITIEDHQSRGGAAAFLVPELLQAGVQISNFKLLGVRDQFGRSAYKASELYRLHEMDAQAIVNAANSFF